MRGPVLPQYLPSNSNNTPTATRMPLRKKNLLGRRLHCETLEPRLLLSSNAPFNPVLDLQVDSGVAYDQSTGKVSGWDDEAVASNRLRSSGTERPLYGAVQTPTGLDAIRFDGVDDRLIRDLNDAGGITGLPLNNKERTMFLVARFHDTSVLGGAAYGRAALNQTFGIGVGGPGTEHGDLVVQGWKGQKDHFSNSQAFSSPGNSEGWMVLSAVHLHDGWDPADNGWLYRDGVEIASWTHKYNTKLHSTHDINGNTASRLILGEGIKEHGHVKMDVAAWLIYDEALSTSERTTVEGFLTATYLGAGSNQAPTANNDSAVVAEGGSTVIDILENDSDLDGFLLPSSVTIVSPPSQATSFSINAATGAVTYVHNSSSQSDSFTYTVEDNLGETSNLATVTINISSDVLPITGGLVTLLEANSGVNVGSGSQVTSWIDGSANGIQLFASGDPQWVANATPSGEPAIVFDGAGDKLELIGHSDVKDLPSGGDDRTLFVVANYLDPQGVQAGFAYGKANGNRTFGVGVDGPTGQLAVQGFLPANDLISTTAGAGQGWQLQSVVLNNNLLQHFENGALVDSWTHTYNTRLDAPASKIVLGQSIDKVGYSQLQVGAVLVYDRALSASERQQVENYLANKYTTGSVGNQPPTANNDNYSTLVGGTINTALATLPTVLANDTDPNFDPLQAILISGPSHGSLTLNPNGSFVYTNDGSSSTDDSFTYRAFDGTDISNLATVNLVIQPLTNGENSLLVRWHGDYYKHLWDDSFPGGSNPTVRENRWLRGGPVTGNLNSQQDLDLDNDGQLDDSRVYLDFSLDVPLNPPNTTSKTNGIIYHSELPGAQFYGGLSADYYNYETARFQQAFIENDGGGGELNDVGYPSPYLTPQYQGLSNYIELVRHADGRPKRSHIGPHEDFAINIYRPDQPHPINPQDNPADNLVAFHAAFLWKKADFLAGGDSATISLDAESSFSFESSRWWENIDSARWIVQSGSGQLYISQFSAAGLRDNWGFTNEFLDPLSSNWAAYNPSADLLDFNQSAANWINPVANNLFNDIQALGLYLETDTPTGNLTKFSLQDIRFNAVVGNPAPLAADSPPPPDSLGAFSLDSLSFTLPTASQENAEIAATLSAEPLPTIGTLETQSITSVSQPPSADFSLLASNLAASHESPAEEEFFTELQSLDEMFALWV